MSFQGNVNLFIVLLLTFTLKAWNLRLSHEMEAVSGLGTGRQARFPCQSEHAPRPICPNYRHWLF